MKTVGVILVSILPVLIGLEIVKTMKKRLGVLKDYFKLLIFIREQIRYFGREISEITAVMKNKNEFSGEHFSVVYAFGREKALPGNAAVCLLRSGLKKEDTDILIPFLEGLGLNDTEGQLGHCGYYEERLKAQINEVSNNFRLKSRLYISLFGAAALTLFILII